jgi:hypothetical protein
MQTNDAKVEESTRRITILESQVDQDDQNYLVGNFARLPVKKIIPEEEEGMDCTPDVGGKFLAQGDLVLKAPEVKISGFAALAQAGFQKKVLLKDELMKDVEEMSDEGALEAKSIRELGKPSLSIPRTLKNLHQRPSMKILQANKGINKDVSLVVNSKNR